MLIESTGKDSIPHFSLRKKPVLSGVEGPDLSLSKGGVEGVGVNTLKSMSYIIISAQEPLFPPLKKGAGGIYINDHLRGLVSSLDVSLPSLYTFYDYQPGWVTYAIANIMEARRMNPGKPVFAFLWPQYHDSNKELKGKYIPGDSGNCNWIRSNNMPMESFSGAEGHGRKTPSGGRSQRVF
jgi:hypothetical protein